MTKLAIHGGDPTTTSVYPSGPFIDDSEREAALRVLETGVLSGFIATPGEHFLGGPEVRNLEQFWCELGSYTHVVAMNSATAALHAGVAAMELAPGTEVIVPPFTMSATVAAVQMAGLVPRFADVDPALFTLTAKTVEKALTPRTGGIIVVHLFGQMAPMEELLHVAEHHGVKVLEDNAQSPGATQGGRWPGHGTVGAVFSFNQHKTITCGEGGLFATNDERAATISRLLRNHAEAVIHAFPDIDPVGMVGWNYRLTEVSAAIALAQSAKLRVLTSTRIERAERLTRRVAQIPGLEPPRIREGNTHVYFTYALRFNEEAWGCNRGDLVDALRAEGIPCAEGYVPPLYRMPLFDSDEAEDPSLFPDCERLAASELILMPVVGWPASAADVDRVADALEKCWDQRQTLQPRQVSSSERVTTGQ